MEEQTKATKWQGTADLNNPLPVSTEDFIKAFGYSGAEPVLFQMYDDSPEKDQDKAKARECPARSLAGIMPELHRLNEQRLSVCFRVCGGGTKNEQAKARGKARAQFMEIDEDSEGNKIPFEEQLQIIKQFALEPSIIVRTQKSLHTYWLLSDGSMQKYREIQERLQKYFASDPSIVKEAQAMRLPGFLHQKGEPVLVQVIKFDPGIKYTQQELATLLPQIERKERTELPELTADSPGLFREGNRDNGLIKLGGHLRAAGCNAREIELLLRTIDAESGTPLPESQLNKCIKQALEYNRRELAEQMRINQAKQDFAENEQPEKKADFFRDFLQIIQTDAYKPYPTECDFFDNVLNGGVIRQSLLLLLAAPATGKTTLCQQLAEEMARHGKKVLYVNLEMSRQQMLAKAISYRLAKKNKGDNITAVNVLQGYNWTEEQRQIITEELQAYMQDTAPNITYHDRPNGEKMTLESLRGVLHSEGEKYKEQGEPAPAVVIDYLHLLTSERAGTDPAALLKEATDCFKQYAINYNTFVILICATNRESNKKGDITLESGRDSSALEYTGDYVLSLQYTAIEDGIVNPDDKKDKKRLQELQRDKWRKMTMTVLKNRFGIQGRPVQMWFKPSTNIFYSKAAADFFDDPDIEAAEQKLRKWINEKKEAKEKKATNGGFKKTGEDWDELTGSKPKKA